MMNPLIKDNLEECLHILECQGCNACSQVVEKLGINGLFRFINEALLEIQEVLVNPHVTDYSEAAASRLEVLKKMTVKISLLLGKTGRDRDEAERVLIRLSQERGRILNRIDPIPLKESK